MCGTRQSSSQLPSCSALSFQRLVSELAFRYSGAFGQHANANPRCEAITTEVPIWGNPLQLQCIVGNRVGDRPRKSHDQQEFGLGLMTQHRKPETVRAEDCFNEAVAKNAAEVFLGLPMARPFTDRLQELVLVHVMLNTRSSARSSQRERRFASIIVTALATPTIVANKRSAV